MPDILVVTIAMSSLTSSSWKKFAVSLFSRRKKITERVFLCYLKRMTHRTHFYRCRAEILLQDDNLHRSVGTGNTTWAFVVSMHSLRISLTMRYLTVFCKLRSWDSIRSETALRPLEVCKSLLILQLVHESLRSNRFFISKYCSDSFWSWLVRGW